MYQSVLCYDLRAKFRSSSDYIWIRVGPQPPVKATTDDDNDDNDDYDDGDDDDDEDGDDDDDGTRDGHDDRGERQTASPSARGREIEQWHTENKSLAGWAPTFKKLFTRFGGSDQTFKKLLNVWRSGTKL